MLLDGRQGRVVNGKKLSVKQNLNGKWLIMSKEEADKAWESENALRQAKAVEAKALANYENIRWAADKAHEDYSWLRTQREKIDPAYAGLYKVKPHAN